jgi:hypothetical protein
MDEKRNALQAQVDSQKAECSEKLAALKTHNEQITYYRTTFHDGVKTILQDNCDLRSVFAEYNDFLWFFNEGLCRIKLAEQNMTLSNECPLKLDECIGSLRSAQIKANGYSQEARAGMAIKGEMTQ